MSSIIEGSAALRKRKNLKRGIQFTLMVVGQSGCGRSTFINTLCGQQVVDVSTTILLPTDSSTQIDIQLREETIELEDEEGVKIQLNIIDTPGFGDSIDNSPSFGVICDYVRHQYDEILLEESRVRRNPRFKDGRVHCCLYLINPTGHGLKELDVEFIKKLGTLVNIIPVIAKSDSLVPEEVELNKKLIMEDIQHYNLPIFNFPFDERDITGEDHETNTYLRSLLPFTIIGSNEIHNIGNGEMIRGRKFSWGTLDVEDSSISDFVVLRNTLLISHLHDLKDYTHEILYERYRTDALSGDVPSVKLINSGSTERRGSSVVSANNSFRGIGESGSVSSGRAINQDTYLAREEQIRLEEERLKAFEERVQQELQMKRQELLQREQELKEIEERLEREAQLKQEKSIE